MAVFTWGKLWTHSVFFLLSATGVYLLFVKCYKIWHNWCKKECWGVIDYLTLKGKKRIAKAFSCQELRLDCQVEWFFFNIPFFFFLIFLWHFISLHFYRFWMLNTTTLGCFSLLAFTGSFSSWIHRDMEDMNNTDDFWRVILCPVLRYFQ